MTVASIISKLDLKAHPEGGFFKETYRSGTTINIHNKVRNVATGIYYLLDKQNISHLHRVKSDEMWHFYSGTSLRLITYDAQNQQYKETILNNSFDENTCLQYVVPAGVWMAAEVIDKKSYSLVGCTVSPGFDFEDFEMATIDRFDNAIPEIKSILERYIL